jgi:hypothetical protein
LKRTSSAGNEYTIQYLLENKTAICRLVELGKLEIKTEARDRRECMMNTLIRKVKNKAGVIETRIFSCFECGEEFCDGIPPHNCAKTDNNNVSFVFRQKLLRV